MTNTPHTHMSLMELCRTAALAHGLINIGDTECAAQERFCGRAKRVELADGTPALIYVGPCWRDEWIVSITLWPASDAEEHVSTSAANARAGEVFAWGWLNRWQYHGRTIGIERFDDARAYVAPARRGDLAVLLASHVAAA
ncbi:hypothetical protein [uncultured Sphingomonas sp.]|uniref:hypothetical protein n=1 Tax=uncultured Sphingomonas sp. TaxID=158754 RepID=UPI0025CC01A9|nr:hypothetical protein [uncultured Sphingomonas sp.]